MKRKSYTLSELQKMQELREERWRLLNCTKKSVPQSDMSMSKFQLFSLLACDSLQTPTITIKGVTGILLGVSREDGSGSSFIVTLSTTAGNKQVHVRTVD